MLFRSKYHLSVHTDDVLTVSLGLLQLHLCPKKLVLWEWFTFKKVVWLRWTCCLVFHPPCKLEIWYVFFLKLPFLVQYSYFMKEGERGVMVSGLKKSTDPVSLLRFLEPLRESGNMTAFKFYFLSVFGQVVKRSLAILPWHLLSLTGPELLIQLPNLTSKLSVLFCYYWLHFSTNSTSFTGAMLYAVWSPFLLTS